MMLMDILTGNVGGIVASLVGISALVGIWWAIRRSGIKKEQSKQKDKYIETRKDMDKVKPALDYDDAANDLLWRQPRGDM